MGEEILERKKRFSTKEAEQILEVLQNDTNKHRVGVELFLKEDVAFEDTKIKIEIENCLNDYVASLQRNI